MNTTIHILRTTVERNNSSFTLHNMHSINVLDGLFFVEDLPKLPKSVLRVRAECEIQRLRNLLMVSSQGWTLDPSSQMARTKWFSARYYNWNQALRQETVQLPLYTTFVKRSKKQIIQVGAPLCTLRNFQCCGEHCFADAAIWGVGCLLQIHRRRRKKSLLSESVTNSMLAFRLSLLNRE
jgi:hypothetical protein